MRRLAPLGLLVAALTSGCGSAAVDDGVSESAGSSTEEPSDSGDSTGSETSDTETSETDTGDTDTGTDTGPKSTVGGWVSDMEGTAIAGLPITLCGEVCQIGNTDELGYFEIPGVSPGVKVVEPALVPAGDDLGAAVISWTRFFDFVTVVEGEDLVIEEPFVMLRVDDTTGPLLGEQTLDLAEGLQVSFDADAILDDGPLPAGATGVWLGATAVPEQLWPVGGLGDWNILAVWSLAIWDLEAPDVFAVSASLAAALDPDTEVAFLVADYTYGFTEGIFFEEPAELSPDGLVVSTLADGGIDRATRWLIVTR